jgi:hypothetical protein
LGLGLVVRLITVLGFPPAIWFGGDSASYLSTALYHAPGTSRLSGYGFVLFLLKPFHSFAVVTAVQHLMGLAVGVMIYALLRRYGLPGWGATLAALPVLLNAYQTELEHEILPAAATLWPVGLPVLIVFLLYLAVRRVGWRAFGAAAAAGAVPLAGYVLWFHGHYGRYAFSNSDGIYLWSRTMTFANCAVIQPPAGELVLCPRQPVARPARTRWRSTSRCGRSPPSRAATSLTCCVTFPSASTGTTRITRARPWPTGTSSPTRPRTGSPPATCSHPAVPSRPTSSGTAG